MRARNIVLLVCVWFAVFAATHLAPFLLLRPPMHTAYNFAHDLLFNASLAIAYAVVAVFGGYIVKRRRPHPGAVHR
jgi:hypothetical protein